MRDGPSCGPLVNPHGLDPSVSGLGLAGSVTGEGGPGRGDAILRIALASTASALAVGAVDLDHPHALGQEVAGQIPPRNCRCPPPPPARPRRSTAARPGRLGSRPGRSGRTSTPSRPAGVVQSGNNVHVEVGVDPRGDPQWQGGHGHPFVGKRWGWHRTCRDDGQDSDGPSRRAPVGHSVRPVGVG